MRNKPSYILLIVATLFIFSVQAQDSTQWNATNSEGQKVGPWRDFYENGNLRYDGQFNEGQPFDVLRLYFPNGKLKTVLKFTQETGNTAEAKLYYPDGVLMAEGNYLDQKKSGEWKSYSEKETLVSHGSYIDGKKFGDWKVFYPQGQLMQEVYMEADLEKGIMKEYFKSGELQKTAIFTDGFRNGPAIFFKVNGDTLVKGNYIKDVRDGDWIYFNEEGKIDKILKYKKGELLNPELLNDEIAPAGNDTNNVKDQLDFEDLNGKIKY